MKIPLSSGCGVPPPVGTHSATNIDATLMEQDDKPPNLGSEDPSLSFKYVMQCSFYNLYCPAQSWIKITSIKSHISATSPPLLVFGLNVLVIFVDQYGQILWFCDEWQTNKDGYSAFIVSKAIMIQVTWTPVHSRQILCGLRSTNIVEGIKI